MVREAQTVAIHQVEALVIVVDHILRLATQEAATIDHLIPLLAQAVEVAGRDHQEAPDLLLPDQEEDTKSRFLNIA